MRRRSTFLSLALVLAAPTTSALALQIFSPPELEGSGIHLDASQGAAAQMPTMPVRAAAGLSRGSPRGRLGHGAAARVDPFGEGRRIQVTHPIEGTLHLRVRVTPGHGPARVELSPVPDPPTLLLLGSGILGLAVAGRRRRAPGSRGDERPDPLCGHP